MPETVSTNASAPVTPKQNLGVTGEMARSESQMQVVWAQFRKHQLAVFGGFVLLVLYIGAIFAPFISPYGISEYSTTSITKYHPPTHVYFRDPATGALSLPYVYSTKRDVDLTSFETTFKEDRGGPHYPIRFFVHRPDAPYTLFGFIKSNIHLFGVDDPAHIYVGGADGYGRDLYTRIWFGAQISLTIGIVSASLAFFFGLLFGGMAGYYSGWVDNILMRFVEILSAIPDIFLLIALTAFLPQNMNPIFVFYGIVFLLGLLGWGGIARTVRSQILALREVDYVQAATALGAPESRIILRHMLPSTASYLIVSASLAIPGYILTESALSFIGRGIREPYSSWGLMLNDVTQSGFASFTSRPWVLIPGFFIVLAILSWNFLGDGLRDAFDPKKRR